ncbi:MAG: hypothetical protein AUK47_10905 [Deltaproteobacteria bacterium CG2_30_63_29]|nr:MAG: hypothetical protein AUK47_10905 [Deltaproteobacteria bacterium CG2_30_63_29]PIV98149.1 MAG: hypothetical protein COW42_16330 [Deltaproteobacteria bacterium CG17_big_fil_post_rev_8_21_14_2_50_63_7]PJB34561.1 MAG: hypothetical protein CO108_27940 [Deltaproteobacteria bacterium CG_4_9_14_3_um_filter_63_12]
MMRRVKKSLEAAEALVQKKRKEGVMGQLMSDRLFLKRTKVGNTCQPRFVQIGLSDRFATD